MSNFENDKPVQGVEETNLQKLLSRAYCPEQPDAAFAAQVERMMLQAAAQRAERTPSSAPTGHGQIQLPMRWLSAMAGAAAAIILCLSAYLIWQPQQPAKPIDAGGDWIASLSPAQRLPLQDSPGISDKITPRKKEPAKPAEAIAVGAAVQTGKGERKRLAMPDGSILYVNQNTNLTVSAERRIELASGQVYVEVSPRAADDPAGSFAVVTPQRQVVALGTKFQVSAEDKHTNVVVTQGKVAVRPAGTDAESESAQTLVQAGRQLSADADGDRVAPAPPISQELDWTAELMRQADTPLVPAPEHEGGALVAIDPNGQEVKLSLRNYHIDVHIEDGFARTTIDQTYFNHENRRLEGTFYFPLPPDASLSRLAMYVNGQLNEGGMAERDYARATYESIVTRMQDPALLEWVDGSTFKMRVFPLEARQEKRIIISYVQRLEYIDGQAAYRFPGGHTLQYVGAWSFHARVKDGQDMQWASESHNFTASRDGGDMLLDAKAKEVKLDQDLVLRLSEPARTPLVRFSSTDFEGSRYLMLRYRPVLPDQPTRQGRNWVFLFESSADRNPLLARAQIDVLRNILAHAERDDRFSVLAVNTRVHAWSDNLAPVTPDNIQAAVEYLEKTHLVGALDLEAGLSAAAGMLKDAQNGHVVHLGGGTAILGIRADDALVQKIPADVKYVGIGVGKKWARGFMKLAAARSGGFFTQINPDENIPWRSLELVSILNRPRLLNVTVADPAAGGNPAGNWLGFSDSVRNGEELSAVTRLDGGAAPPREVAVTGMLDGKPFTQNIAVSEEHGKADYLPRMWARLEIDRLIAAGADANRDRIVALSKSMYVMSPFTSLLVLENEQMYEQYKVDRGRKDHWAMYPAPAKIDVVTEPIAGKPPIAAPDAAGPAKLTCEQIMGTIIFRAPRSIVNWPYGYPRVTLYNGQRAYVMNGYAGRSSNEFFYGMHRAGDLNGISDSSVLNTIWYDGSAPGGNLSGDPIMSRTPIVHRFSITYAGITNMGVNSRLGSFFDDVSLEMLDSLRRSEFAFSEDLEQLSPIRGDSLWTLALPAAPGSSSIPGLYKLAEDSERLGRVRRRLTELGRKADFGSLLFDGKDRIRLDYIDRDWSYEFRLRGVPPALHRETLGWRNYGQAMSPGGCIANWPGYTGDWRAFSDIIACAPGINTSWADVLAIMEAEAGDWPQPSTGRIDAAARKLIDAARGVSWRQIRITLEISGAGRAFDVLFDGAGRFAYQRRLDSGLIEQVYCDGKTLWRLYAEIGVGAKRAVSRYHREDFEALVPFVVAPAEELARGCDVLGIDEHTVAIVPIGGKDDASPQVQLHLVFGDDGSLVQRKCVLLTPGKDADGKGTPPTGKVLYQEDISPAGVVKITDADGVVRHTRKYELTRAMAPKMDIDESLVVVPMPIRTVVKTAAGTQPVASLDLTSLDGDEALRLVMACIDSDPETARKIIGQRFFAKGNTRIGLYTLLSSCNSDWVTQRVVQWTLPDKRTISTGAFDPRIDHPYSPLARYIAQLADMRYGRHSHAEIAAEVGTFVGNMAEMSELYYAWSQNKAGRGDSQQQQADWRRIAKFISHSGWAGGNFAALMLPYSFVGENSLQGLVRQQQDTLRDTPELSYAARYWIARHLTRQGQNTTAQRMFVDMFEREVARGYVPYFDGDFYNCTHVALADGKANGNSPELWNRLVSKAVATLIEKDNRTGLVGLMRQCWNVGDQATAEDVLARALAGADDRAKGVIQLSAIQMFSQGGRNDRAAMIAEGMLKDKAWTDDPWLLRICSTVTGNQGRIAQSLKYLEKAIDIEYANMPDAVNLQAVRQDYSALLGRYQQVAVALATLDETPSTDLMARIVRAADRWRALDSDDQGPCQAAAKALQGLGATDLAWDYLTSPLATRPNEAQPWLGMAGTLKQEGQYDLAGKAYASAFAAEGSNAQILWDWAQMLQQTGRNDQAREVYRKIAKGDWQPRFSYLKEQAKRLAGN